MAQSKGIKLAEFNIIYRLTDHITEALISLLPVQHSEKRVGEATVLQIFSFEKSEQIAGCRVDDGQLLRSREKLGEVDRHFIQLFRNEKTIWTGRIATMRHVKKEIPSAGKGMECGILLEECTVNILPGDKLMCFEREIVAPSL
jgi:translation initiation factor IF-2